jgi:putative membrane protein
MTYSKILLLFLGPPLVVLLIIVPHDVWRWLRCRKGGVRWLPYLAVMTHVLLALIYTTPWDNYLVATGVWWYQPNLVSGWRIGYVPIEEYSFFVLQTLLTGLWLLLLRQKTALAQAEMKERPGLRLFASLLVGVVWLASLLGFFSGWLPGVYLSLILVWGLIPLILQLAFGADYLIAGWRLLLPGVLTPTVYLWELDAFAIRGGTWTIDPRQTTGWMLAGLPMEEMLFFFVTNLIIAFGIYLMLLPSERLLAHPWLIALRRLLLKNERFSQ